MSYISLFFLCAVQEDGRSWERHRANSRILRGEARENYLTFDGVCVTRVYTDLIRIIASSPSFFSVSLSFCPAPDVSNAIQWQGNVILLLIIYLNVLYSCHIFALCNPNGCKICFLTHFRVFLKKKKLLCVAHFTRIARSVTPIKELFHHFSYCYQLL